MKNNDEALSIKKEIGRIIDEIDYLHVQRLMKTKEMQDACSHPSVRISFFCTVCTFCGKVVKK